MRTEDTKDFYNSRVLRPDRNAINRRTRPVTYARYGEIFGPLRGKLGVDCAGEVGPVNMPKLCSLVWIHPKFRAYGFTLWLEFLKRRIAKLEKHHPELHAHLYTAGTYCPRLIRGGKSPSVHTYGCATDFGFYGTLDALGAGDVRRGYLTLYEYLKADDDGGPGAYWGAGFTRCDSMHFECSTELFEKFLAKT